ncbi:MAG: glycosyl hydrolase [Proteobacteria bacterium]|nr:glycosyl hydrolase [Pseudomonadota bacterium]
MSGSATLIDIAIMLYKYNTEPYEAGENKRLGIPAIRFTDGPRGIVVGNSTCFPVASARGATWDIALEERVGSAMGIEARAQGANFFAGVCINAIRHPGWGRAQETYGEDPHLLGEMGSAVVRGTKDHVMTCVKHFACNSIEESRFYVDVKIDERTLREVYLPHFKKCIDAGAVSVMSAYNQINGEHCGHNRHLLSEILKQEWGFEGFVITDFVFGIYDGKAAANAGLDIEMPNTRHYGRKLLKLVNRKEVSEETIDNAAYRILREKLKFSMQSKSPLYTKDKIACKEHKDLAYETSCKSIVLLKNENSALPFDLKKIRKIAVLGELAAKPNIGDMGSSRVRPPYTVTTLEGIKSRAGSDVEVVYYGGGNLVKAARIAGSAQATVVIAGLTKKQEGEHIPYIRGGDREYLGLPKNQRKLIQAACHESSKCVVVLQGGSAITMEDWKDRVDAILMAWYPGMEGGGAIADILFGNVNPSGKLPMTFCESQDQLYEFDKKAKSASYSHNHGYRHFDEKELKPAFWFGFGLSYTKYEYTRLKLAKNSLREDEILTVHVDITNKGDMAGEETVQLYVGYDNTQIPRPKKELKAFKKVSLKPAETKTVRLEVKIEDLAYYDIDQNRWEIEKCQYTTYVGPSSDPTHLRLNEKFTVM